MPCTCTDHLQMSEAYKSKKHYFNLLSCLKTGINSKISWSKSTSWYFLLH